MRVAVWLQVVVQGEGQGLAQVLADACGRVAADLVVAGSQGLCECSYR